MGAPHLARAANRWLAPGFKLPIEAERIGVSEPVVRNFTLQKWDELLSERRHCKECGGSRDGLVAFHEERGRYFLPLRIEITSSKFDAIKAGCDSWLYIWTQQSTKRSSKYSKVFTSLRHQ